ncbi:hypothetical protein BJD55_gp150 [Gordonia phage Yvonnetastic]|uniref:Uncharacterized protein n=1 Tax=Gordonia phage Yvonnetastic TaxID=1821566 RepID=A0A142K933_9CAUD|nr:hypothetical protein BJD55_gp150 [Gordonia phage Yvonnetastic]AMS02616.1 hypothetical protein SEA_YVONNETASTIC_72 [Gordonia phage Yvonnetastic]WKW86048.1 hypothetical protein SEA_JONJAMES_74 [Gordonia Phage JonJames]
MTTDEQVTPGYEVPSKLTETAIHGRCQHRIKDERGLMSQCDLIHKHKGRHADVLPSGMPRIVWEDHESFSVDDLERKAFEKLKRARDDVYNSFDDAEWAVSELRKAAAECGNERLVRLLDECKVKDYYVEDGIEFPFDDTIEDFMNSLGGTR